MSQPNGVEKPSFRLVAAPEVHDREAFNPFSDGFSTRSGAQISLGCTGPNPRASCSAVREIVGLPGNPKKDREPSEPRTNAKPPTIRRPSYYAHRTPLDAGPKGFMEASLQETINDGSCQCCKLIKKPSPLGSCATVLIWDTSGFFSG
jgi:hypothetical protein